MTQYMVEFELPEVINDEFISMIPQQRATINNLMNRGIITTYTLAQNRGKLWVTMVATDKKHVKDIIHTFPLIDYMIPEITELMFHESVSYRFPSFSLN